MLADFFGKLNYLKQQECFYNNHNNFKDNWTSLKEVTKKMFYRQKHIKKEQLTNLKQLEIVLFDNHLVHSRGKYSFYDFFVLPDSCLINCFLKSPSAAEQLDLLSQNLNKILPLIYKPSETKININNLLTKTNNVL